MNKHGVVYDTAPRDLHRSTSRWLTGAALLLLLIIACTISLTILRDTFDPLARAEREATSYRAALIDEQLSGLDLFLAAIWRIVPLAGVIALGSVGVLALYRRVAARETTLLHYEVQALQAQHQPGQFPHSLHYSPHLAAPSTSAALPPAVLPDPATEALPGPIDFAQILSTFTPSKDHILLGFGPGNHRITVSIAQLCHVALCGATGGGKSNLHRLLIPQLQFIGAKIVLGDPHYTPYDIEHNEDWRPIARKLYRAPAVTPGEIDELLDWLTEELQSRLELRQQSQRWGPPLFLAFDELPVIANTVKQATERLGRILREGRKVHMFAIGAAQDFLVKTIGGSSAIRDAYRTAFYVGGDRISASALLDLPQREIDDGPLGAGLVLLRSAATRPAQQVRIPLASNQALYHLLSPKTLDNETTAPTTPVETSEMQGIAPDRETTNFHNNPGIEQPEPDRKSTSTHSHDTPATSDPSTPTDAEKYYGVKYLRSKGWSKTAIIKEIWGKTGRNYDTVSAAYEAIVRQLGQEESKQEERL